MGTLRGAGALAIAVASCACATTRSVPGSSIARDPSAGVLFVYSEPASAERARGAGLDPSRVDAVHEDGSELPLKLAFRPKDGSDRWGLLAFGRVPEGRYTALRLTERPPARRGPGSDAPPPSRTFPVDLRVGRGRGAVVLLGPGEEDPWAASAPRPRPAAVFGAVPVRLADALLLFDRLSGEPAAVVPTGARPTSVAIDVSRSRAYVALAGEDAVEVVDLVDPASLGTIPLVPGDEPATILLSPDGATAITANRGSGTVSVVDVLGRSERARIRVGERPTSLDLDPLRRTLFVAHEVPSAVTVVDLVRLETAAEFPTEGRPIRIRFDPLSRTLWVAHAGTPSVLVLEPATGRVLRKIELTSAAAALALDLRAGTALVASSRGFGVDVFGPNSGLPLRSYPAGGTPRFLEVDSEGNSLCIVYEGRDEIRLVRLVGGQTLARIETGPEPGEPAFSGSR